jgi:hypothetical protein
VSLESLYDGCHEIVPFLAQPVGFFSVAVVAQSAKIHGISGPAKGYRDYVIHLGSVLPALADPVFPQRYLLTSHPRIGLPDSFVAFRTSATSPPASRHFAMAPRADSLSGLAANPRSFYLHFVPCCDP